MASACDEAADTCVQPSACASIWYTQQCAVCCRKLRCYTSQSTDAVFTAAEQTCYYQRDGPPLWFCGKRCHRLYEPWINVMEDCVSDAGADYAGLEWAAEEAKTDCRQKLRAVRLFVGVCRAVGKLLLLHRRSMERVYAPCGAGYREAKHDFFAAVARSICE